MMLIRYKYFYWFAFPAFVSKPAWEISDSGWLPVAGILTADVVRYFLWPSFIAVSLPHPFPQFSLSLLRPYRDLNYELH
jgi:hypothetical protein